VNLIRHILRRSFRSVWENLYLNTVAASVIGASLLLLGVYIIVHTNLNSIVDTWNKDVHVSAYFADNLTEEERFTIRDRIHGYPEVLQVRYVSELDAKKWLSEEVEGIEATLNELGDNALPASLEITLSPQMSQPDLIEQFATKIETVEFQNIDYGVEWVDRFNAFLRLLQALGTLVGILILLAATFLVTNTVHLVVYNRKSELEIAKLVGASQSFIILPFIFEGAVQGLFGGLAAISGLWLIHNTLSSRLQAALDFEIATQLQFLPFNQLLLLTAIGIGLGTISAFIATHRFLRQIP
jgi:cell division transport system permease protein